MNSRKIALCGCPWSGKASLLLKMLEFITERQIKYEKYIKSQKIEVEIPLNGINISIKTWTSVMLEPDKTIPLIIGGVNKIIYIFEPITTRSWEEQHYYFKLYGNHAKRLSVDWDSIPWVFMLNKTDIPEYQPLPINVPAITNNMIYASAYTGLGIPELWTNLLA